MSELDPRPFRAEDLWQSRLEGTEVDRGGGGLHVGESQSRSGTLSSSGVHPTRALSRIYVGQSPAMATDNAAIQTQKNRIIILISFYNGVISYQLSVIRYQLSSYT